MKYSHFQIRARYTRDRDQHQGVKKRGARVRAEVVKLAIAGHLWAPLAATPKSGSGCRCKHSRCIKKSAPAPQHVVPHAVDRNSNPPSRRYCDCFAAGRWCKGCNCVDCHNDLAHAKERDEAIRATLEKNPKAFRAKVKDTAHASGCHCKKSKCLKKYCECFEAGIHCGAKCKCADCENYEGSVQLEARRAKLKGASRGRSSSRPRSPAKSAGGPQSKLLSLTPT